LNKSALSVDDLSIASLEITQSNIISLYSQSKVDFGSQASNIKGMKIELINSVTPETLSRFKTAGIMAVTLDPGLAQLRAYSNVLATKIGLEIDDNHGPVTSVQATITHEGRALIFDQQGQAHTFSHVPVSIPYEVKEGVTIVDGSFAPDTGDYEGISPYGPWTIHVTQPDKNILANIKSVRLVLDGKARGRAS
jgi:hypothetical protein